VLRERTHILPERPHGVYIIGMVCIALGTITLISGIDLYFAIKVSEINPNAFASTLKIYGVSPDYVGYSVAVLISILGMVIIAASIGFLRGIRLSWKVLMVLFSLIICGDILGVGSLDLKYSSYYVGNLSIYGVILYYLFKPHIRSYFGK